MRFDRSGRALYGNGFDHVGIKRSLDQKPNFAVSFALLQIAGCFVEYGDEFPADDFSLLLGVSDTIEFSEEAFRRIYTHDVKSETVAVHSQRVFEFVLP